MIWEDQKLSKQKDKKANAKNEVLEILPIENNAAAAYFMQIPSPITYFSIFEFGTIFDPSLT